MGRVRVDCFEEPPLHVLAGAFARSDVDVATLASESLKAPARGAERLLTELQEAWNTLAEIKRRLLDASTEIRQHSDVSETLGQIKERYERETRLLLVEPIEQFARLRPFRRSLEELERASALSRPDSSI